MFTPHPPTRQEDAPPASRMPSGSSILFPSANLGKSPLVSASPAHVPFTLPPTPAGLDPLLAAPGSQPPRAGAAQHPFAAFTPGATLPAAASSAKQPPPSRPAAGMGAADDRPPLLSLMDVGFATSSLPASAPFTPAPAPQTGAAPATGGAPLGRTPGLVGGVPPVVAASGEQWVTAFGFPSAAMLPAVLEELRPSSGEIRQHRIGSSGLWVHVRYADAWQLQQALAKNGKLVGGFLLGVIDGIQPSSDASHSRAHDALPGSGLPLKLQQHRHVGPALRAPPIAAADLGKAGWWTKLCEYVFGW